MKRCMVAVDVQNFYRPSPGIVTQLNQLASTMPTAATLYRHNENAVPLARFGHQIPQDTTVLVNTIHVFEKNGYLLPESLNIWLRNNQPDEVLVTGGHTDANVLAAGFSVFSAGFRPVLVPVLCYGNDWYMHTVTAKIWEQELGKVYQSVAELQFGSL